VGDALAVVPLGAQQNQQDEVGQEHDDHECRQRPERVDVVGEREPPTTHERAAETEALDHRDRHGETEEGKPRDPRQDEEPHEDRDRREHEDAAEERGPPRWGAENERARTNERRDDQRRERQEDQRLDSRSVAERQLRREGERDPEHERLPEALAVGADRLRDELPDGAVAGRKRRGQLTHP